MSYVELDEFLRRIGVTNPTLAAQEAAQQCIDAAATEIDSYLDWPRDPAPVLDSGQLALLAIVNTSRGAEHWRLTPYGTLNQGADIAPVFTAVDSFTRHRRTLQPLKDMWGVA